MLKKLLFVSFIFLSSLIAQNSGSFDINFNDGSSLQTFYPVATRQAFSDMVIQSDDKIIVCAKSEALTSSGEDSYLIYRIKENGEQDSTFGVNSFVDIEGGTAYSLAIQDDGKILVIGVMNTVNTLVRLNSDGSLDNSFGNSGKIEVPMRSFTYQGTIYNIKILSSGKILLAGVLDGSSYKKALLIQLNEDGTIDTDFGNNGYIEKGFANTIESAHYILEQPDGKIIFLGHSQYGTIPKLFAARINTDGTFDDSFGTLGYSVTEMRRIQQKEIDRLKGRFQNDGKIVVAGYAADPNVSNRQNFAAVRFNADGSIDNSFGTNGYINIDFNETGSHDYAYETLITSDGKIVLGGSFTNQNNITNFGILVVDENGNVDPNFGVNGRTQALGYSIRRMFFDSKNRIVAGGFSGDDNGMALARFIYDETSTSVNDETNNIPDQFSLSQNYPNPFNPTTSIEYIVPSNESVSLKVYDILGNEIAVLVNESKQPGSYHVAFDASKQASGVYLYKLSIGNKTLSKKMLLLK